jgi:GT2 family glycosyltransferase
MQKKLAIGIPTFNRWDLLEPTLNKYLNDFPNIPIFIWDNGNQNIANSNKYTLVTSLDNKGVAYAWNRIMEQFPDYENVMILNDDIYLGKHEQHLLNFIDTNRYGFFESAAGWCTFILPQKTYQQIGVFDETFYPAYCEDNDYSYRMKLAGVIKLNTPFLIPTEFRQSQTLEKNPELFHKTNYNSRQYYKKKWGGYPEEEVFTKPFNL